MPSNPNGWQVSVSLWYFFGNRLYCKKEKPNNRIYHFFIKIICFIKCIYYNVLRNYFLYRISSFKYIALSIVVDRKKSVVAFKLPQTFAVLPRTFLVLINCLPKSIYFYDKLSDKKWIVHKNICKTKNLELSHLCYARSNVPSLDTFCWE